MPATVVLAEHLGDTSILHLRVDGIADLLTAKLPAGAASLHDGDTVRLIAAADHALAFDAEARALEPRAAAGTVPVAA